MRRLQLVAAVLTFSAWSASAQEIVDGLDLFDLCKHHPADAHSDQRTALSLAYCYGLLKGVGDAHANAVSAGTKATYCLPAGKLQNEQARLVFVDWAAGNPERLDLSPARAVAAALGAAYPCER